LIKSSVEMGIASELGSGPSPISPGGHTNSYPESLSQIGDGTLADLDPNPLHDNAHNLQL
jgi:hypothetical protein